MNMKLYRILRINKFLVKTALKNSDNSKFIQSDIPVDQLCDIGAFNASLNNQVARLKIIKNCNRLEDEKQRNMAMINNLLQNKADNSIKDKLETIKHNAELYFLNKKTECVKFETTAFEMSNKFIEKNRS